MLAMLLPITLPTAISGLPFQAACKDTNSSGEEVAMLTTVSPISSGETVNARAVPTAPRTIASPPTNNSTKPAIRQNVTMG